MNGFAPGLLQGQIALVTGGGSGIGYAIAKAFLELGASVWICGRNPDKLQKSCEHLLASGSVYAQVCDIREPDQVQALAEQIAQTHNRLDLLVNNAGGQFPAFAEAISPKGFHAVIRNNLEGTWIVTWTMANRFFIPQKQGSIIHIIANIWRGFPGMMHTGAARAGVDNMTKTLAVEWSRYNIRVNAVAPGIIQSSGLDQYPPDLLKGLTDKIPLRRLGRVEEVADLVVYLASPMASYITGETIYIDGGQRLWGNLFDLPS